jgi:AcrR family transcriptional regulator
MGRSRTDRSESEGPWWCRGQYQEHWGGHGHRGRGREAPQALNREQIVRAAIAIADAFGSDAISMRKIAAKLGAGAMSLYWHVENKEELLEMMIDQAFSEMDLPEDTPNEWRTRLRIIAIETRKVFKRHPWIASVGPLGITFGPGFLRHAEFSFSGFEGTEISGEQRAEIVSLVDVFAMGFVTRELRFDEEHQEARKKDGSWRDYVAPYFARFEAEGLYPTLVNLFKSGAGMPERDQLDRSFLFGLDCLLSGIAANLDQAPASCEK